MACTLVGFFFFHIAAFGCKTFETVNVQQYYYTNSDTSTRLGYWSVYNDDFRGCLRYSNDQLGSIWRFGRFIGIFGSLLAWTVLASILLTSCFKYPKPKISFPTVSICMGIMSLFSFLLLVGLASRSDRFITSTETVISISSGSYLAIFSAFIWAGGSAAMIVCVKERTIAPVPTRPVSRNAGPSHPASNVVIADSETSRFLLGVKQHC